MSLGQRQLLCLCRAVLRNSKILIMDEATASLDLETGECFLRKIPLTDSDEIIQTTVKSKFNDSTVLIIAHRLETIIECDRIMVFDMGYLVEMDTPAVRHRCDEFLIFRL